MKRANSLTWFSLFFLFSIGFTEMCAQDRIIKTNQDTIHCQIKEILDDEVKYIDPKLRNDLVFGIDKNKVDKIVLANGAEVEISDSMYGKAEYEDQSQNVIKARLFGPLYGALDFSFEHSIKPGSSYEGTIGFIGTGLDNYGRNPQGAYVKLGYKLIKSPDFYLKGMRYAHILKGSYVRPEIIFAAYEVNKDEYLFDIFYEDVITSYSIHYTKLYDINATVQVTFSYRNVAGDQI